LALSSGFDFTGFARAMANLDAAAWVGFFADDAEWVEYKHTHPPRSPRVIRGKAEIGAFVERICGGGVQLTVEDHVVGLSRASFRLWVTLSDGRRIIEHVIIHHDGGKVTRQVDVEAWDPEQ